MHCDLNTKNILINYQDVSLIDFGLSVKRSFKFDHPELKTHEGSVFMPQNEHDDTLISDKTWYFAPETNSSMVKLENGVRVFLNTQEINNLYLLRDLFTKKIEANYDSCQMIQKIGVYYFNGFYNKRVCVGSDIVGSNIIFHADNTVISFNDPRLVYPIGYRSNGDEVELTFKDLNHIYTNYSLGELSKKHHKFSGISDIYSLYFVFISILGTRYDQQNIRDIQSSGLSKSMIFILNLLRSKDVYSRPSFEILKLAFLYEKYRDKDKDKGEKLFAQEAKKYNCKTINLQEAKNKVCFLNQNKAQIYMQDYNYDSKNLLKVVGLSLESSLESKSENINLASGELGDGFSCVPLEGVELELNNLEKQVANPLALNNENCQGNVQNKAVTVIRNMEIDLEQQKNVCVATDISCGSLFANCCKKISEIF